MSCTWSRLEIEVVSYFLSVPTLRYGHVSESEELEIMRVLSPGSKNILQMFDIIRKPVEGSKHSKKQIDLGSVFEVAKDERKPVPRRKEKLFEEKKRDITQSTIKGFNREPNPPATNGDEPDVAEADPKLAVKSC